MDATAVQVRLLGGFEVRVGGEKVPAAHWRQRRAAAVVKLLALDPGHRLHREQVCDALWPDLEPESAANNLRVALHHARRGIETAGAVLETILVRDGDHLLLGQGETVGVDVDVFTAAVQRAWQGGDAAALERAAALYTGDLLPEDPYEEWAAARRESLRASYLTLLARAASLHEQSGDLSRAVAAYERLLTAEPLDEAAHAALMRLHARMGHPELALARFARFSALLERELDATPERETAELARAIREGRIAADPRPAAVPETRAAVARGGRVPAALDALIGRARELAELERLLTTARLVTLTGPGGIGKTRLAQESAGAVAQRFPQGVAFVDLSSLRDPALVLPAIARALAIETDAGQPIAEQLSDAVGERQILLVLDNLEQVTAAAGAILALIAACPKLTVLATSRVRLRLRGEQEYPVLPLACPEPIADATEEAVATLGESPSVALFTVRAQAARPDFALAPENAAAIVGICRKLDGLPLAIELAAARIRVLPPAQLLRRLDQPLDALGAAASDVPARQRTLRDTVAWSYDLLAGPEPELFRRLGVFVGGFTLEGASAVAVLSGRDEYETLDTLAGLIDHSLLTTRTSAGGAETRYAMLETIREYAAEKLAQSAEADRVQTAFHSFVLAFVARAEAGLRGAEQLHWLALLEEEHENIRCALGDSLDGGDGQLALQLAPRLWQFWRTRGYAVEGHTWLKRTRERASTAAATERAAVEFALGKLSIDLGDYAAAEAHFLSSAELWHEAGDEGSRAQALSAMSTVKINLGQLGEAETLGEEALAIALRVGDERGAALALLNLGMLAREDGRHERAIELLGDALAIWRRLNDPNSIAIAVLNLGTACRAAGQTARAAALLSESGERYAELGDRFHLGVIAHHLGHIEREAGRLSAAQAHYAAALDHFEAVHSKEGVIESIEWIAVTATLAGQALAVLRLLAATAAAREQFHLPLLPPDAGIVNASRAAALRAVGDAKGQAAHATGLASSIASARKDALALAEQGAVLDTH